MSYQQAPRRGGGYNRNSKRKNQNKRNNGFEEQVVGGNGEVDLRGGGDTGVNGNNEESGSDQVFGSADDEGVVEVVSSEDEVEEPESIVNASLIVNLSNANVSQVIEEDRRCFGGLDLGKGDESSDTLVGGSPVEEEEKGVVGEEVKKEHNIQVQQPDVVAEVPGSTLSNSSEESSTLADSEVEKLMSLGSGGVDVARLPGTVTVLKAPNGVTVYLVGTAHFSQQSQVDVVNVSKT